MSSTNSLNYLFLKRFIHLLRIFLSFSNEYSYSHPLILVLIILINEVGLQVVIYFVFLLPADYYVALGKPPAERDFHAFRLLVIRSFGLVALNALLKSLSSFLASILYIKWRTRLIMYLHSFYFTQRRYYHVLNGIPR